MAHPSNKRLTGLNPLAYLGVEPLTPPLLVVDDRNPTVNDYENFNLGSFWLNNDNEDLFVLVNKSAGVATWAELSMGASGTVDGLVADDMNTALPSGGLINILGGTNINTTASGSSIVINVSGVIGIANGGTNASSFSTADGTVYYDGTRLVTTATGIAGQVLMSNGAGMAPTYQSVTLGTLTFNADSGSAVPAADIIIMAGGSNINTSAAGNTVTYNLNNAINLPVTNSAFTAGTLLLNSNRFLHAFGTQNAFLGINSGNGTLTGTSNTGLGFQTFIALTTGSSNVAVGSGALTACTTGTGMTAVGVNALASLTTSLATGGNTAIGASSLFKFTGRNSTGVGRSAASAWVTGSANVLIGDSNASMITDGSNNTFLGSAGLGGSTGLTTGPINESILIGFLTGNNYSGTESSNIIIGNRLGVAGDNNTIRIGVYNAAPGAGQQNQCFIAAAYSNFGTRNSFVGEQAGNDTLTTGSAVDNVAVGFQALTSITTGAQNTAVGSGALPAVMSGGSNTAIGYNALLALTSGTQNTAVGSNALAEATTASFNTAVGTGALFAATGERNVSVGENAGVALTTGDFNTFVGHPAAFNLIIGNRNTIIGAVAYTNATGGVGGGNKNIVIGESSGNAYMTDESDNLLLNSNGTVGDNQVMRIGYGTAATLAQTKSFINGIRGVTTTNNDAIAVLIDSAGQLGTVSSSRRNKTNIKDMETASDFIYKLRPVTFSFVSDRTHLLRYGLIAEEVEQVNAGLVAYTEEGEPMSVKYHDLPALLLNEIQKLNKRIEELEKKLSL
jgi:hypothetical protein